MSLFNLYSFFPILESLLIPFRKRAAEREVIETIGDIMVERVGVLFCFKIISWETWIFIENIICSRAMFHYSNFIPEVYLKFFVV